MSPNDAFKISKKIRAQIEMVILDKEKEIALCVAGIFARGHLLIEDIPGTGKTTLVKALGKTLGLSSQRIQFTNDLLPSDIIGTSVFNTQNSDFSFKPGPLFSGLVFADELNRTSPKTQSAFLQAMEEGQVSVDGVNYDLPEPFAVVATQNPQSANGTYLLPESQLDRFLMRIDLGLPSRASERVLLLGEKRLQMISDLTPATNATEILQIQKVVDHVTATEALLDYFQDIVEQTRKSSSQIQGVSPRGALSFFKVCQAWALLHDRDYLIPEDVQETAPFVLGHRLNSDFEVPVKRGYEMVNEIVSQVSLAH